MIDPHVESLTYVVLTEDDFSAAQECPVTTDAFGGSLVGKVLTLKPKNHYSSEQAARSVADWFVRAWEISAGLAQQRPVLRFQFSGSLIIDQAAPSGHPAIAVSNLVRTAESVGLTVGHRAYPQPPAASFSLSPEVEILWDRFSDYRMGKQQLLSMAYFCLTVIEQFGGGSRDAAAKSYSIDKAILGKIGEITSRRGDYATARKLEAQTAPLSSAESTWLEAAIVAITTHIAAPGQGQLQMRDLPAI